MAEDLAKLEELAKELPEKITKAAELALRIASEDALSKISSQFKSEGRALGETWAPLKESYLKQKIKKGYSEKILHRTTTLAQSFTYRLKDFTSYIGTPVPYAVYHEYGTKKMPARPFMAPVAEYLKQAALRKAFERAFSEVL